MAQILTAKQIMEWDEFTIKEERIHSIDLMERASSAFVKWFLPRFDTSNSIAIFCGPGNNGGDGFAIARLLFEKDYHVFVFDFGSKDLSPDCWINRERLANLIRINTLNNTDDLSTIPQTDVVMEAIFGIGLARPLNGIYAEAVNHLNKVESTKISVDIASGLFAESESPASGIFQPDFTVTFQIPKLSLLLPQNDKYVGDLNIIDIGLHPSFLAQTMSDRYYVNVDSVRPLIKKRGKFSHKGDFGKSLIIGGSYGMIGAVLLSAKACYRTGAGLVKLFVPKCGYIIAQTLFPEATVETDQDDFSITSVPSLNGYNAIAVGPGLSEVKETEEVLFKIFKDSTMPMVLDAGALNLISRNKELLELIPKNSILTPHLKEFERLFGSFENDYERLDALKRLAQERSIFIILKGAHTVTACPDGSLYFNSTGNPGMAKGGSGDVLTGIICGLLSQCYEAKKAAILGVFMHGFAGDKAVSKSNIHTIIASDIIENISEFYKEMEI
ncbi:MAG TPA: NAD(P)H-hydrate dehydratase [Cytophagaceae bacterium]|jgi:NAD(P)H-hydrate epimerase